MTSDHQRMTFAVLGDIEPKPKPDFSLFHATVRAINELNETMGIQFTASIGDLAHTGKIQHYEALTDILSDLSTPFYAIMGNEELAAGRDVFLKYVSKWNDDPDAIPDSRFVLTQGAFSFIFATAETGGVTFDEEEIAWVFSQVENHAGGPIVLFTHAPPAGIFPESKGRWMQNDLIDSVLKHPDVVMHFSGHTHFDLDTITSYAVGPHGVHHVHVPGVERTKVGLVHTPRFRVVEIDGMGDTIIHTYNVLTGQFEKQHEICFSIS